MTEPILQRSDSGGVATLTLNAASSLNALSDAMLDALLGTFADLAQDRTVKVVILRGNGKAFCAGHDLKECRRAAARPTRAAPILQACLPAAPR